MALKVSVKGRLTISQDNAANPQDITFDSGEKTCGDTTNYNESVSHTFNVPAGAVDTQIDLGSLTELDVLFLMAKSAGLLVKLIPTGATVTDITTERAFELLQNYPCVVPAKLQAVYVSNPGPSAATLILGAAGN